MELVDREADLLVRGMKEATLQGQHIQLYTPKLGMAFFFYMNVHTAPTPSQLHHYNTSDAFHKLVWVIKALPCEYQFLPALAH